MTIITQKEYLVPNLNIYQVSKGDYYPKINKKKDINCLYLLTILYLLEKEQKK